MKLASSLRLRARPSHAALAIAGAVAAMVASVAGVSCAPDRMPFKADETHTFAGGITVTGAELNLGYQSYTRYCYACHGTEGDGKGPSSYGYRPPPRNFQSGIFKFARMRSSDDLPNDDDLVRIVRGGLHGTPMLEWDVPEAELRRILQYIKTFAPARWEKKRKNGDPVKTLAPESAPSDTSADPWAGHADEAARRGRELYHFKAECVNCHPAYGERRALYELSVEASAREPDTFKPLSGFREDLYGAVAKDSSDYGVRILPPDFTFNEVRSARAGHEVEDLFRVISYGVYPIMPAWQGALSDKDIWALAHYVHSLMALRGSPEAMAMQAKLVAQPPFQVPKAPEPSK